MHLTKQQQDRLREEWENKLYSKKGNESEYWLPTSKDIADFWLSKIETLLKEHDEMLVEKIEKLNRFRCGACDGARCSHCQACEIKNDIINLIKETVV